MRPQGPASPVLPGEESSEDLLAFLDGRPLGLVQRSRLADYPEYLDGLAAIVNVQDDAMTIDYLIGDPHQPSVDGQVQSPI